MDAITVGLNSYGYNFFKPLIKLKTILRVLSPFIYPYIDIINF